MIRMLACLALLPLIAAVPSDRPPAADPLTVTVHSEDADRFAEIFAHSDGKPSAVVLQHEYLDPGSVGIRVFTPSRIGNAQKLADRIAANPEHYAQAIKTCLPAAKAATADLRSIYLGLHGALPEAKLPQVYVVFGAGNSGGTAAPGVQVLGLEVLCRIAPTPEKLRRTLRQFFAHETVHSFQQDAGMSLARDPLLASILAEGAADFVVRLVTGEEPDAARATWALPKERELWARLQSDLALTRALSGKEDPAEGSPAALAYGRWVGNYGHPPKGWPPELGYWMGMRIWERYYAAAPDKHAALKAMLAIRDPRGILRIGALPPR